MSQKVKIELNTKGIREFLLSEDVANIVTEQASNVLSRVGEGYELTTYKGKNRVNASVKAMTDEAYRDNLENNTLAMALFGG